jgi:hypothetical protein
LLGLLLIIIGAVLMSNAVVDVANNVPIPPAGIKPAIPQQDVHSATTALVLISIGTLMLTSGLVAEIVMYAMRPSSAVGGSRRRK